MERLDYILRISDTYYQNIWPLHGTQNEVSYGFGNGKLPFSVQWREKSSLNQKGKGSLETVCKTKILSGSKFTHSRTNH